MTGYFFSGLGYGSMFPIHFLLGDFQKMYLIISSQINHNIIELCHLQCFLVFNNFFDWWIYWAAHIRITGSVVKCLKVKITLTLSLNNLMVNLTWNVYTLLLMDEPVHYGETEWEFYFGTQPLHTIKTVMSWLYVTIAISRYLSVSVSLRSEYQPSHHQWPFRTLLLHGCFGTDKSANPLPSIISYPTP